MNSRDFRDLLSTGRGKTVLVVGLIIAAFALGHYWPTGEEPKPTSVLQEAPSVDQHDHASDKATKEAKKPTLWTCSMHPQIKLPHPGKCPICFMDLIPLETGGVQSDVSAGAILYVECRQKVG